MGDRRQGDRREYPTRWQEASLFAQRNWLGAIVLLLSTATAVLVIKLVHDQGIQSKADAQSNRLTSFTACVKNGNTLRLGLRNDKNRDIRQAKHPDPAVIEALGLSPADLDRLIAKRVRQLRRTRDQNYALVDCLDRYPPLEQQVYPPELLGELEAQLSEK